MPAAACFVINAETPNNSQYTQVRLRAYFFVMGHEFQPVLFRYDKSTSSPFMGKFNIVGTPCMGW